MKISISLNYYTPIHAVAYAGKAILSTCYKIVQFICSKASQLFVYAAPSKKVEKPKPEFEIKRPAAPPPIHVKKLTLLEKISLAAVLIGFVHYTDPISWLSSFGSTASCISYYGDPTTFEDAKSIFRCDTPFYSSADPSKGWDETRKTFRLLSKFVHPDKNGDEKIQYILSKAKELLEYAFTTEEGQRELKIYGCISQVPTPQTEYNIENARKIFDCAGIDSYQKCWRLQGLTERMMNQISWVGGYSEQQLNSAWNCICHWN